MYQQSVPGPVTANADVRHPGALWSAQPPARGLPANFAHWQSVALTPAAASLPFQTLQPYSGTGSYQQSLLGPSPSTAPSSYNYFGPNNNQGNNQPKYGNYKGKGRNNNNNRSRSGNYVECQICKKLGQIATTCYSRYQPQANVAHFGTADTFLDSGASNHVTNEQA